MISFKVEDWLIEPCLAMPRVYKPENRQHYTEQALKDALKKRRELYKNEMFDTYNFVVTSGFKSVI